MNTTDVKSKVEPTDPRFGSNDSAQPASGVHSKLTEVDQDSKTVIGGITAAVPTGTPVLVGEKVGKYEIRSQLGSGGMGAVFLAFDPLIEREVALKVLSPELSNSSVALQRFLGEARAIGRLNHPNVVSIYDIDQWNGQYYLVMELLSGGSVAERVERQGRMPWKEACALIAQAAHGLAAAHEASMIHRDIKPENLMLTRDNIVKVVDFGLSKLLDASHDPQTAVTKAGQILGTPQYMSPEQFESGEIDARTDIYSLGATLFRLLTARFPYHDCRSIVQVMTAHMTKPPPAPTEFDASIPAELDRLIKRSMAKNPADRYQTASEFAFELEAVLHGESRSATESPTSVQVDHPLRTAVIVEPSKLQAIVLKNACSQAGLQSVNVLPGQDAARQAVSDQIPDLFITAMQLPDGQGIDLLRELCQQSRFQQSTAVLNSGDCSLEELATVGPAACLVLAPKKVRPDEILRVVHAVGPGIVTEGPLAAPIDPLSMRLQIVVDTGRIPDKMADLLRELQLLDVDLCVNSLSVAPSSPAPNLILHLRCSTVPVSSADFADLIKTTGETGLLTAAVQLDQGELILRAVNRNGVVAICQRVLNSSRMVCLLQGCRS